MSQKRESNSHSRWSPLVFDGDADKYELWETKFLDHLRLQGLKEVILKSDEDDDDEEYTDKNAEAYAELIHFLDYKSLAQVMRDATNDGRKALQILRNYYAGKRKRRIISLYTELTSLLKGDSEGVTDYVLRAEATITALKSAGESLSDGLLIAMVMKGLPESFQPFIVHVTQSETMAVFEMSQFCADWIAGGRRAVRAGWICVRLGADLLWRHACVGGGGLVGSGRPQIFERGAAVALRRLRGLEDGGRRLALT